MNLNTAVPEWNSTKCFKIKANNVKDLCRNNILIAEIVIQLSIIKKNIQMLRLSATQMLNEKQVRTNIGLAEILIPSSVIYLIYMGGTGPCDSMKIIFGYHVNS